MTRKIGAQIIKRDLDLVISDIYIYIYKLSYPARKYFVVAMM